MVDCGGDEGDLIVVEVCVRGNAFVRISEIRVTSISIQWEVLSRVVGRVKMKIVTVVGWVYVDGPSGWQPRMNIVVVKDVQLGGKWRVVQWMRVWR